MDLLGGYGSGASEGSDEEGAPTVAPAPPPAVPLVPKVLSSDLCVVDSAPLV